MAIAESAEPLAKQGRPSKDEEKVGITTFSDDSRDAEYLTRRIARDRPDVLERMKAGEFPIDLLFP